MVLEEGNEAFRRKIEHARGGRGPDCSAHGHQIVVAQARRKPVAGKVVAKRALADGARFQVGPCALLEAQDLEQHLQEARRQQVAALGEERAQHVFALAAAPFEPAAIGGDGKTHF